MSAATKATINRLCVLLILASLGAAGCTPKTGGFTVDNKMRKTGSSTLIVVLKGLPQDSTTGNVYVALWGSSDTFMKNGHWMRSAVIPIAKTNAPCVFAKLPAGTYSVSAFYDVTNSGSFRRNGLGIPIDPWAISNGGPPWSPPNWEHSIFELGEETLEIELEFNRIESPEP